MKDIGATLGGLAILVLCVAGGLLLLWGQYSVWSECRADHSWLYCVHLVGR